MAWEIVEPKMGRSAGPGSEVTVAWRRASTHIGNRMVVNIAKALMAKLSWEHGAKIQVERDRDRGMLRLSIAPPQKRAMTLNTKDGTGSVFVRLDGIEIKDAIRAEIVQFTVEGSALLVTLPDWAAPERVAAMKIAGSVARGMDAAAKAAEAARARMTALPHVVPRAGLGERVPDPMVGRRVG